MAENTFDIAVIGGGISGLGAAWMGAAKGYRVIVLEKGICARETSNNSLRIIHGGFRYLQKGNLKRVVESLKEQAFLLEFAPELIKLLPCVMPLGVFGLKSPLPARAAAGFYSALTRFFEGRKHMKTVKPVVLDRGKTERAVPVLKGLAPHGALHWHDALVCRPLEFAKKVKRTACEKGATVKERCPVEKVVFSGSRFILYCRDLSGAEGKEFKIESPTVINAAGPWIKEIELSGIKEARVSRPERWCRGFNLVLNRSLEEKFGIGVKSKEGRLFFFVPRETAEGTVTVIGTEYLPYADFDRSVSEGEISNFLKRVNRAFPPLKARADEVAEIECGILPARGMNSLGPRLYGSEKITARAGYIEVMSTKYTTFRSQGMKAVLSAARFI